MKIIDEMAQKSNKQPEKKQLDLQFLSPIKTDSLKVSPETTRDSTMNELVIKVIRSHGNPHICGLTEIELFDEFGVKIPLLPSSMKTRNIGNGPQNPLERLIDGKVFTKEDKNMWIGFLPSKGKLLEIVITFQKDR